MIRRGPLTDKELARLEKLFSSSILRLRMRSPFFATLALYARFYPSESIPTAASSGLYDIHYNPHFLIGLSPRQQDAVFLHHVLHLSLLHSEIPLTCSVPLWSYAADIIVNGVIAKQDFLELIPGAVRNKELEDKPIAEIYEILLKKGWERDKLTHSCFSCNGEMLEAPLLLSAQEKTERRAYWSQAMRQALLVQRTQTSGHKLPEWLEQLAAQLEELNEDWRSAMWRFLVKTPADFDGFDRRMVNQGFYLEETRIDDVQVIFGVDITSGVDREQWTVFVTEASRIVAAYPHLQPSIVFQHEQKLFGPFDPREKIPEPFTQKTAGAPLFWEYVQQVVSEVRTPTICVYLTDGFGQSIPEVAPNLSVLWLVLPGGRRLDKFPFGRAVRFLQFG